MADLLSYLCAALAAFGNAIANVMQRKASLQAAPGLGIRPGAAAGARAQPTWLLGISGMVGSFVLQAVALGLGELSAVEPIITLEVPLTMLVASYVFHTQLGRQEWTSILVMTGGMIALVAALDPMPGDESNVNHVTYVLAGGGTAATIVVLIIAAQRQHTIWRTACLGAAAGTSFGLTATLVKESVNQLTTRGIVGLVTHLADLRRDRRSVCSACWSCSGPCTAGRCWPRSPASPCSIRWSRSCGACSSTRGDPDRAPGWCWRPRAASASGVGVALLARSPLFDPEHAEASGPVAAESAAARERTRRRSGSASGSCRRGRRRVAPPEVRRSARTRPVTRRLSRCRPRCSAKPSDAEQIVPTSSCSPGRRPAARRRATRATVATATKVRQCAGSGRAERSDEASAGSSIRSVCSISSSRRFS